MAKKKNESKKKKKLSVKNKKSKKNSILAIAKETKKKKDKKSAKTQKVSQSEKLEIWNKNFILAGIVIILVVLNAGFYIHKKYRNKAQNVPNIQTPDTAAIQEKTSEQPKTKEELEKEEQDKIIQALLEKQEMEKWKTYKNTAYGFMLKYPDNWLDPVVIKPEKGVKFRYKVSFRNASAEEAGQKGFDVVVYRSNKLSGGNTEPEYTDNLVIKDSAAENYENCLEPDVHEVGPNKYPAIEVSALKDDPCFQETYFFSIQKGSNIFDVVPFPEGGVGYPDYDGEKKVAETLPEFNRILSTFELLTIAAKKTTVVPRITAPKPVAKVKNVGGKRVCAKKNDKPHKSKQNKKKHMDMECCLDPDEIPNPWCTY